jgi:hypothetical protein
MADPHSIYPKVAIKKPRLCLQLPETQPPKVPTLCLKGVEASVKALMSCMHGWESISEFYGADQGS